MRSICGTRYACRSQENLMKDKIMNATAEIAKKIKKELTDFLGKPRIISCKSRRFANGNGIYITISDVADSEWARINEIREKYKSHDSKFVQIFNRKSFKKYPEIIRSDVGYGHRDDDEASLRDAIGVSAPSPTDETMGAFYDIKKKMDDLLGTFGEDFKKTREGVSILTYLAVAAHAIEEAEMIFLMIEEED